MRQVLWVLFLVWPIFGWAQGDSTIETELKKLAWQVGPSEARIGDKATIKVPDGYVFLDDKNTRRFLELMGNPPPEGHYLFAPKTLAWFAVFSFNPSGYVKDDEKIDPDELLKSLKANDEPSNEERQRLGMSKIYTDGWEVLPHYDNQTKRLEWGLRLRNEQGRTNVNYTSRLLGRSGVMSATLVTGTSSLAADSAIFKTALEQFSYAPGENYSEFKQGDKLAAYGLGALILGGAAAVATKKGLWAVIGGFFVAFWKILVGVFVAAVAGFKSMFKKKE
ncbi:MAG: DUF2167 domain-containing protein [Betaproteobacteria bacterium]|nr:DUF2167 domain-containing protein [Betaproteobacteria bacterium]